MKEVKDSKSKRNLWFYIYILLLEFFIPKSSYYNIHIEDVTKREKSKPLALWKRAISTDRKRKLVTQRSERLKSGFIYRLR